MLLLLLLLLQGFWEERLLRLQQGQQLGPAVLLFGCRSKDTDYLMMVRRG
jgi:hypothetical protein